MAPAVTRELSITYGSIEIASVASGTGVYTLDASQDTSWIIAGITVAAYGCSNAANNGEFVVTSISGTTLTLANSNSVSEASSPGKIAICIGGASDFELHSFHRKEKGYEKLDVIFEFSYQGSSSETAFRQFAEAAEAAFRLPEQRLRIVQGSETLDDYNPANESGGNTGFLQQPHIRKVGNPAKDSGRSRHYEVTISLDLPADRAVDEGRRRADVLLTYDPARRRTVTMTGVQTAIGSNGATAQFNATKASYASSVLGNFGGSSIYEITNEDFQADKEDKLGDFRLVYREILYNQSSAGLDHAAIVDPSFDFSQQIMGPGDSSSEARRLEVITCVFDSMIDNDETTDLDSLWDGTIKPYLVDQAKTRFSLSGIAIVDSRYNTSPAGNRIRGVLQIHAQGDSTLIQYTFSVQVTDNKGKRFLDVWDGNPRAAHVYQGPAPMMRVTIENSLEIGSVSGSGSKSNPATEGPAGGGGGESGIKAKFAEVLDENAYYPDKTKPIIDDQSDASARDATGWVVVNDDIVTRPLVIGVPPDILELFETTRTIMERYVEAPSAAGGGGAGGDVPTL